jgi:hypothetical protein
VNAPRWFYYLIAACVVVLTAAASYSLVRDRWQMHGDETVFNPRTAEYCTLARTGANNEPTSYLCLNLRRGQVTARKMSGSRVTWAP